MNHYRIYHHRLSYEKLPVPGWKDIRNTTDVHSLYWIQSGEGEFVHNEDEEAPFSVQAGDLIYLKPGFTLTMASSTEKPLCIRMLLFDCLDVPFDHHAWHRPQGVAELPLPFHKRFSPEQAVWFEEQFGRIWTLRSRNPQEKQAEFLHRLTQLIRTLQETDEAQLDPYVRAYNTAKQRIETSYHLPLKLEELAKSLHISVSQLRKLFILNLGLSPKAYLNKVRNEHARTLLLLTDEPMKAIAEACGFADEFHFGKMFRSWNGVSPARYRARSKHGTMAE
ncbi:AraC family transcriptional regulator [Paenibacillus whitsoniae]|uniref:AraC family transcriptional regulator n=1 Tax=Paenibacillus whitsoniae TaxID=2496558 RepID=A0A3S0A4Q0_9BACL|nr:AraC family transcriptional regulator [Paenibacillus whitsoniae]RTE09584.1 AraC family transcriptional regulator [Paenibacillus whitsoniae]